MFLGNRGSARGCLTDEPFRLAPRCRRMRQDDRVLANHPVDSDGLHTLKPMA
ncbi:MAG: hypothetical protein GDA49_02785 [Rhodospirillales bacterium]|nr:hypothetical protein [Rhodospirillales bacterium]